MTLVQSMPKGERLDLILQKCTEIGVSEFLIIETERTIVRISPDKTLARLGRWRAIVREAAEQSGRALLPVVEGVSSFCEAMARAAQQPAMIAWEGERSTSLLTALQELGGNELTLFIGPEGGFTTEEVDAARSLGIIPVSLGPRILRTETAAIVASALAIFVTANWKYP
jgi:16S rRNA (uracil1498-N3)-methyltransferase